MLLELDGEQTFADPQAAITWSEGVNTSVKTDVNLKTFIGRGSGESVQLAFSGKGWLLIQPSEGRVTSAAAGGSAAAPRAPAGRSASCSAADRGPGRPQLGGRPRIRYLTVSTASRPSWSCDLPLPSRSWSGQKNRYCPGCFRSSVVVCERPPSRIAELWIPLGSI